MVEAKICGLCRPEDAAAAVAAGADYVGVILAEGFARTRTPAEAAAIFAAATAAARGSAASAAAVPARVGVFVDAAPARVVELAGRLGLDVVQLHGEESREDGEAVARAGPWRVWKVLRPREPAELVRGIEAYADAVDGILLDGWSPGPVGGAGARLAWRELAKSRATIPASVRVILAGGLTPENVAEAIRRMDPHVVDVSSGVEATTGEKSAVAVRRFIEAARAAGPARAAGKGGG